MKTPSITVPVTILEGSHGINVVFQAAEMKVELRLETALCAITRKLLMMGVTPQMMFDAIADQARHVENDKILASTEPVEST